MIACISQNLSALYVIMNKHLKLKHLAIFRQKWLMLAGYQLLKGWVSLLVQTECTSKLWGRRIKFRTVESSMHRTKKQLMVRTTTILKIKVGKIQGQVM
jgi:hypothetical protein